MFGRQPDGTEKPAAMDLVRLALPRRVYTQSHADYIIECFAEVYKTRDALKGYEITWEAPSMRHFTSKLKPLNS
jgi:tryptophanase